MRSFFFFCTLGALLGSNLGFSATVTLKSNVLHSKDKEKNLGLDQGLKEINSSGGTLFFSEIDGAFDIYLVDTNEDNMLTQARAVNSSGSFLYGDKTITIDGKGGTLFGNRAPKNAKTKGFPVRGFFVGGINSLVSTNTVTIQNITFSECGAIGGIGGGGGMGAGGGVYVGEGTKVFLNNCSFKKCLAMGGAATNSEGIGGGGMKGVGNKGGGGGFGGNAGSEFEGGGGASSFKDGDARGGFAGNRPGGDFDGNREPFGADGIGGGVNQDSDLKCNGGFGGGGGNNNDLNLPDGGTGIGGYGGGGGFTQTPLAPIHKRGRNGGFGGGGCNGKDARGGDGGFGAGGGLGDGKAGFGGGAGSRHHSGNGAGFGGAIFMEPKAEVTLEGTLMLEDNMALFSVGFGNKNTDANAGYGRLGNDIFMMSSSLITFNNNCDVLLQNPIQGDQGAYGGSTSENGLTKKGIYTLSLVGENTYTGTTIVDQGMLNVNGSLVSNVLINNEGEMKGKFSIAPDRTGANGGSLANFGILNPSPGSVVESGFFNEPGATFRVDITPSGFACPPFIEGDGIISGGNLVVEIGSGNYIAGSKYTLISGTVFGEFDNQDFPTKVGDFAPFVDIELTQGSLILTVLSEHIFVQLPDNLVPGSVPTPIIFSTQPANEAANCLINSSHPPGSDLALVIEALGTLTVKEQNKVLPTLTARQFGSLEWVNARNNSYVADILSQHLFELCCSPRDCCSVECSSEVFVAVFGNTMSNQKRLDELQPYNADSVGVLLGLDGCVSERFIWGGAFGYTRTDVLWKGSAGGGDTDTYYASLYGSLNACGCFKGDIAFLGGGTFNDMERNIAFASIHRTARSDYWSYFVTTHIGLRYDWLYCCQNFQPFGNFDYHYFTHGNICEKNADSLNLVIKSKTQHMMRGEFGLKWSYEFDCGHCCYSPYLGVSWVGEFPVGESKQPAKFKRENCEIDVLSYDSSVQLGAPQAGIKWSHCNGASFLLGYKGLYNGSVRINEVEGRFEYIF